MSSIAASQNLRAKTAAMFCRMPAALLLIAFLFPNSGSAIQLSGSVTDQASRERPINKVINVLKEMKGKLEKEADEDQQVYDAMACWCETNEKSKTKSIADNMQQDTDLTAKVPELAAHGAQLGADITQLEKEIQENEKALAEATEIREKEHVEFNTEEKDTVGTIMGLRNAVEALSKPHAALTQEVMLQVQKALQPGHLRPAALLQTLNVPKSEKQKLLDMLQQAQKGPAHLQGYAPASGEIFGLMKGMKESFETNLANSQTEEKEGAATFASLKAAKTREISSAKNQVDSKRAERASTDERREQSKEDLENAREQVTADQAFLLDLQQRCGSMDKEFADRQKVRADEIKAVSEALEILIGDDSKEMFAKSTRFVQLSSKTHRLSGRKLAAARLLRDAANRLHSSKLALLVSSFKEEPAAAAPVGSGEDGAFGPVEEVLNKLTAQLKKEQEDDVAERDVCIDTLNTNEKELAAKYSEKSDLETNIEELNLVVSQENDKVAAAKAEIAENEREMKIASENREKENHQFQTTVTEQRATQDILTRVLKKLADFYKAAALAQVSSSISHQMGSSQAPPPGFAPYKKAGGANGVMGMIENIMDESKQIETESVAEETEAQKAYEQFIKDSNNSIDHLNRAIADSNEAKSKAEAEKIRAQADLGKAKGDIVDLTSFRAMTSGGCEFLLKNFELRQSARTEEMEALEQARSVMNGAQ